MKTTSKSKSQALDRREFLQSAADRTVLGRSLLCRGGITMADVFAANRY